MPKRYLFSIVEYHLYLQRLLEPFLGPMAMSNNYVDLITLVFSSVLSDDPLVHRMLFINQIEEYGLTDLESQTIFSELVSQIGRSLHCVIQPKVSDYDYTLTYITVTTLEITQTPEKPTQDISRIQQLRALEREIQEDLDSFSWVPEKRRQLLDSIREELRSCL